MTSVNVLETNILHASDVIYWLDGSSAENAADMLRLMTPLQVRLSTRPTDLQVVNGTGKTAFLRRPTQPMVAGVAGAADKQFPVTATYPIAGVVADDAGRFVPRRFSIDAGNGVGHGVVVYPSPLGTRFGTAGGLIGTLRFDGSGLPVPWALLTLTVTIAVATTMTFRTQADAKGDFMLSVQRLPPLPEGIDHYDAELSIAALETATADTPIDPADLVAMQLGELDSDDSFSTPIGLNVVPGEIRLIRSSSRDHLAVQPS